MQVFAVGLTAALDRRTGLMSRSKRDKSVGLLEKLASATGGRVHLAETVGELRQAVEQIAAELHSEYVVGFAPTGPAPDNKPHKIELKAFASNGADKLNVVIRPAPAEKKPEEKKKKD